MPLIYLRHPVHGAKIATIDLEAEYDEQNGWARYNPDDPVDGETFAPPLLTAPRRGRPRKIYGQASDGV